MSGKLSWGLLATGGIARKFAGGLTRSRTGRLLAVGSRSKEKAEKFGDEFDVPRRYGSYESLLKDEDVQAVYISTPHPMHAEWAIKAAEAGKHILCEKPLTLNHGEAMAVVEAARSNDVFLMEAFMYRCHPQTEKLVELVRDKVIGDVRLIRATFGFHIGYDPESRLLANELGGGGILDVGCYAVSMARLIAGVAAGNDFAEPIEVTGCGHLGETGVDEWAVASLRFEGDILAQVATGVQLTMDNAVRIFGSAGHIVVPVPWAPSREGGTTKILVHKEDDPTPKEILIEADEPLYGIEADTVAANIENRQADPPAMSWSDTLGNMKTLDRWRAAVGLVYESEKPAAQVLPVSRRPLAVHKDSSMKYGRIAGLEKKVSRLVMGADNQRTMPHAAVMFDHFFERGGNCFDTAYIYGDGIAESLLGWWIANRGLREQVVILDKGAHTPYCTPDHMTSQLAESLERLRTDYIDIYMLHRDNPDVPVGEFVDVLNEHKSAGRIRIFGGSNWTLERVRAANEYAESKGLSGFSAVSNNLSLARMVEPPWPGCLSASDEHWRAWLIQTQMPLMPWSSQARGFFAGRVSLDDPQAELVRCWHCDDNFQRLARAEELAEKYGVPTINVALAYVLRQPFLTFPLIGPQTLEETRTSLTALPIELTADEIRWLNLEE